MPWKRVGIILAALAAAVVGTGAGQVSPATSGPEDRTAAQAVAVLTDRVDGAVAELVPADFEQVMGYAPEVVQNQAGRARAMDLDGDCSSPAGSAGYDFDRACRIHDYGYDLLRYAVRQGGELGPWARMALDEQFGAGLRARCDDLGGSSGCRAAAWAGDNAVRFNSWRQGYGAPAVEDPLPYVAAGVLLLGACVAPSLTRRLWRGWTLRARAVAAATPPGRDRVIDATRLLSLLVVVAGHWLMAGIVVVDDRVKGRNLLEVVPALQPVTWVLQVMPLFFLAGGFSNAVVWRRHAHDGVAAYLARRLSRLTRPAVVFVLVAAGLLAVGRALGAPAEQIALAGGLVGAPLWFLAVYVVVTAAVPLLLRWHQRAPVVPVAGLLAAVIVGDVLRLAGFAGAGHANFLLVWLLVHQLGFWYADGWAARVSRRAAWACVATSVGALVLLTGPGPYPVSMVGLEGQVSNMSPPTVCLLVVTAGQAALLVLARRGVGRWLSRPKPWASVAVLGSRAMTIYLWHLSVLVGVCMVLMSLDVGLPEPGSALWWVTRPAWLVVLATGLALVVLVAGRSERELAVPPRSGRALAWLGTAATSAGLCGVAIGGLAAATVWPSVGLVLCGSLLVRHGRAERRPRPEGTGRVQPCILISRELADPVREREVTLSTHAGAGIGDDVKTHATG